VFAADTPEAPSIPNRLPSTPKAEQYDVDDDGVPLGTAAGQIELTVQPLAVNLLVVLLETDPNDTARPVNDVTFVIVIAPTDRMFPQNVVGVDEGWKTNPCEEKKKLLLLQPDIV
jgi:hypothetical protein